MNRYYPGIKKYFDILWVSLLPIVSWRVALGLMKGKTLWSDELAGLLTAQRPLKDSLLQLQDYAAPLYQIILRILVHSEYPPEWIIRLPALVFSILGLLAAWWFAKTLFNRRVAAITILLVAVNPHFVTYAGEGRPYTMFLFFSLLSMIAFYRLVNKYEPAGVLAHALSTLLLVYSHYYGFLVVGAQILYALGTIVIVRINRRQLFMLGISFSVVFVMSIPALWLISRYVLTGVNGIVGWIERPQITDLLWVRQAGELVGDRMFTPLCILAVLAAIFNKRLNYFLGQNNIQPREDTVRDWRVAKGPLWLCLSWIACSLYLPVVVSYFWRPLYIPRYGLPVMVPLLVIIAYVISWFRLKPMVLIILAVCTLPIYNTWNYLQIPKSEYHAIVSTLEGLNNDHSPVYVMNYPYCADFQSPELFGLRYYGYNAENVSLITLRYHNHIAIADPEKIRGDRRVFIVSFIHWPVVEEFLKSQSRAYRIFHLGYLHLFEVEKEGIRGRWTGQRSAGN